MALLAEFAARITAGLVPGIHAGALHEGLSNLAQSDKRPLR